MGTSDQPAPHGLVASAWRFAVAGGLNTLVTGAALALLSLVIDPRVAYGVVFLLGIVLSTVLARRFVYGVPLGRGAVVAYVAMYGLAFGVGLAVVSIAVRLGLPDAATGLVVLVTAPLTFLGGRVIAAYQHRRLVSAPSPTTRSES